MSASNREDDFVRIPWLNMSGTGREAGFVTSYGRLVRGLGEPDQYDQEEGAKTLFEWTFKNARTGKRVSIYDYKATSLYNPRYPTPEKFKKLSHEWSISADDAAEAELFITALVNNIGGKPTRFSI